MYTIIENSRTNNHALATEIRGVSNLLMKQNMFLP